MRLSRRQITINAVFCLALLGVIAWALYAEYDRSWKQYQLEFKQLDYKITGKQDQLLKDKALLKVRLSNIENRRPEIRQIWLQDLGEADRCVTCHQGADRQGFEDAPQPFKTHSGDHLRLHPVERFGCVTCHEGQAAALTVSAAHGQEENWGRPLLKGPFVQSSCGKCHLMEQGLPLTSILPGAPAYTSGWRLFQEYNCIGCHKLSGYERPAYIAPSLSSAGDKVNREWLVQWLQDPRKYLLNTKMPRFSRPVEEIENIADYLISLRTSAGAKGEAGPPDTALINEGRDLVNSLGCTGCHIINGKGSSFAPELSRIGDKIKREWLVQWLKDPAGYPQNIAMPNLSLNDNEARSITAYMMTLKSPVPASAIHNGEADLQAPLREGSAAKGRKLVKDLGCTGCHEIEKLAAGFDAPQLDGIGDKRVDELVFGNIRGIEKTRTNWLQIKVSEPGKFATDRIITRMPNYSFSREQSEDLTIFLLGLKKGPLPLQYTKKLLLAGTAETAGKSVIGKYNCLGCHRTGAEGGNIGPDLTGEAKKSRPEWLFNFLKKPYKIRTGQMLRAKMPDFRLSDKEADAITGYLAVTAGESYPFSSTQKKEVMPEDVSNGERLYREIFACSACHKLNNTGGQVGPDHSDIASRLKREWIERWLRDPQAVTPGVIMPRFKFRDWEFEALTDYLMTLGNYRFITVRERE